MKPNEPMLAGSLNKYGFAQADSVWSVNGICPTILAHLQGQIGHQINILEQSECLHIKCSREGGYMEAYEFDSVGITFAKSGNVHSPVSHDVCRTITTFCDHDLGVVVKDERE